MNLKHPASAPRWLVLALLTAVFPIGALRAQTVPTGFAHELVIGGPFTGEPVGLTFLPDGRPLILERNSGGVRLAVVGGSSSVLIHTIPNVTFDLERGLLGVAVDPAWPVRPYLYFYLTRTGSKSVIEMYEASGDLTNPASTVMTLSNPYVVLEAPDVQPFHNGGTLRFGPDGMLYLSIGEDLSQCNSQNLGDLRGSILRLDVSAMPGVPPGPPLKSAITPADNPFVTHIDPDGRLIWAWGLRNPFRFHVDSETGDLYVGDVGFVSWEEVDVIPWASGGGQNFGWPIVEGIGSAGLSDTCGQSNTFTAPAYVYPHGEQIAAVIGGPYYKSVPDSEASLPAMYDGSWFLMDWGGEWMRRLVPGPGGWEVAAPAPGQPSAENWGEGLGQISDIEIGPDGALWLAQKGGALRGIYRIRRTLPTSSPRETASSTSLRLHVVPNPASRAEGVLFRWSASRPGPVSLSVFDASGRRVARLFGSSDLTGALRWNGRTDRGAPAPAGTYFVRLRAGAGAGAVATGRVTLLP